MLPRPIASLSSITSVLLILTANPIALAENPPSSELPLLLAQTNDPRKAEADRLLQQGLQQFQANQISEALQSWEEAKQLYKVIGDQQGEATSLYNIGVLYKRLEESESRNQKILEYWEQAIQLYQAVGDQNGEANSLYNLGFFLYEKLEEDGSQNQKILEYWKRATQLYQEVGNQHGEANSLYNLSILLHDLNEFSEALQYAERARQLYQAVDDRQGKANSLNRIGLLYDNLNEYEKAIEHHQQALEINTDINNQPGVALDLGNIGLAYNSLGLYGTAIEYLDKALTINRDLNNVERQALNLANLGVSYNFLGKPETAIEYLDEALTINREMQDQEGEAGALSNLGLSYHRLNEYERAIEYHRQSLEINEDLDNKGGAALNLGNLGLAYSALLKHEEALIYHQQALLLHQEMNTRRGQAIALHNLGVVSRYLKNYDEALNYYGQALTFHRETDDRSGEGLILSNLGEFFAKQNQPELAISFYQQSVAVREGIRRDLRNLTTDLQQSYTDTVAYTYRSLADLLLAAGRIEEATLVLELLKLEEFQDLAETRGFQMASEVGSTPITDQERRPSEVEAGADPRPSEAEAPELFPLEATVDLIALGQELVDCENQRPVCNNRDVLQAERDAANANFNRNLERLQAQIRRERADDPARLDPAELSRAAKAVVQAQPNTVLIYPVVLEDKLWLVWGAQSGARGVVLQSQVVEVSQAQLGQIVQEFRRTIDLTTPRATAANLPRVQQLSQRLYGWLIEPIRAELEANGIEHLVFSLDRSTRYVPLAALFDGQRYLIEDFTISTMLTAGLMDLNDTLAPTVAETPVLAMGLSEKVAGQDSLPNVPAELTKIVGDSNQRGIFPGSRFLNGQFSLDTLEDNLINHRIVHLATHGIFTSRRPGESYLLLGTGEKLTIPEIQTLEDLAGIHLVTLSACETGLGGPDEDGLEVAGMSYFFLTSGAKSVLGSLWKVSDASTSQLMQGFYAVLAQGEVTKAEALRQAQLQVLATPEFQHPYFWSPFYLVGNNR